MVILLTIMCSVVIFFLVLIISYNLGLKNNWKRKRIESVKNVGDTPRKKQPNQEKKSIKDTIRPKDLVPENFNSVDAIEKLVKELVEELNILHPIELFVLSSLKIQMTYFNHFTEGSEEVL